jgi:hypothetical protein
VLLQRNTPLTPFTEQLVVTDLSPVMAFELKRGLYDRETGESRPVATRVHFEPELPVNMGLLLGTGVNRW